MPGPKAVVLSVTDAQRTLLEQIVRQSTAPHSRVQRATIILALTANPVVSVVSRDLGLTRTPVQLWRDRWIAAHARLAAANASPKALEQTIIALLDDAYRSGTPATFTAEQFTHIMALACESPPEAISHWTPQELALEAIHRGIVPTISESTVGRFLKREPTQTASLPILAQSNYS